MQTYRIYFIDHGGHISRPAVIIECTDDVEATEKGGQLVNGEDVEIWAGDRLVAKLSGITRDNPSQFEAAESRP
jgi:hypothetical protein